MSQVREKLMRLLKKNGFKRTLKIDRELNNTNLYVYTKRVCDTDVSAIIFNLLYDYDCYSIKLNFLMPGRNYNIKWVDKPEVLEEALLILNIVNKFIEDEKLIQEEKEKKKKEKKMMRSLKLRNAKTRQMVKRKLKPIKN